MKASQLKALLSGVPDDYEVQVTTNDPCVDMPVMHAFYDPSEKLLTLCDLFNDKPAHEGEWPLWLNGAPMGAQAPPAQPRN